MSYFYIDLAQLKQGKIFDALVPGSFIDMLGRKVTFKKAELKTYLKNTLDAIAVTKTESGEIVGLPIDARGHDKGDGAGWIVDAKLEDNKIRLVPKWTKIGQDLISGGIRRMFSPTVDTENKIILGGTLTNWPATRDKKGKVMLRPIELVEEQNETSLWIVDEDFEFEEDDPKTDAELAESLNQKSSAIRSAFREQFLPQREKKIEMSPWVIDVFEDHAIVQDGSKYFSAPFEKDDKGKIKFSKRKDWKEVKKSWVEAALDQVREAINSFREIFTNSDSEQNSDTEVIEMELTKEELATLVSEQVTAALAEVKKGAIADLSNPSDSDADNAGADPETDPAVQSAALLAAFGMENVSDEFTAAVKSQLVEAYDRQKAMLVQQSAEMVAGIRREAHVADFVKNVVSGTEENPRGIAVEPKALEAFIMGLDPDQAKFAQEMIEKVVSGSGVVDFSELGNNKPVEGTTELSQIIQDKLNTGALKIADLDAPILGLGDLSKYNLEKWREKSDA